MELFCQRDTGHSNGQRPEKVGRTPTEAIAQPPHDVQLLLRGSAVVLFFQQRQQDTSRFFVVACLERVGHKIFNGALRPGRLRHRKKVRV